MCILLSCRVSKVLTSKFSRPQLAKGAALYIYILRRTYKIVEREEREKREARSVR